MPAIYARQEPLSAALNIIDLLFLANRTSDQLFKQTIDFVFSRIYANGIFKGYYGNEAIWYNVRRGKLGSALEEHLYSYNVKRGPFNQETNATAGKTFSPERWDTDARIKPVIETVHKFLFDNDYPYAERYPNVDIGITYAILITDPNMHVEQLPLKRQKTFEKILAEREAPKLERKLHRINQLIQLQKTLSKRV